jgi:hypothetical protein
MLQEGVVLEEKFLRRKSSHREEGPPRRMGSLRGEGSEETDLAETKRPHARRRDSLTVEEKSKSRRKGLNGKGPRRRDSLCGEGPEEKE